MGIGIGLSGSSVERADLYYNDNGIIRNIDHYDVWINEGGRFFKIPQREHMMLNLDHTSFSTNVLKSASSYLTKNFELWHGPNKQSSLGGIISTPTSNDSGMRVNAGEKFWYINNVGAMNFVWPGSDIVSGNQLTFNMTFKFEGRPTLWNNLWWFEGNEVFRIEFGTKDNGGDGLFIYGENRLIMDGNDDFRIPEITGNRARTSWSTLTLVLNGTALTVYQNREEVKTGTLARNIATGRNKFYMCGRRGRSDSFGCKVYFKNIAYWNKALTKQELDEYWELVPSVGPSLVTP